MKKLSCFLQINFLIFCLLALPLWSEAKNSSKNTKEPLKKQSNIKDKIALRNFGAINFGMTIEEASKISPFPFVYPLQLEYKKDGKIVKVKQEFIVNKDILKDPRLAAYIDHTSAKEYGCYYINFKGYQRQLGFMVSGGKITRVDVWDSGISTLSGAKVGDSEERIKQLYGDKIKVEPHKYTDKGHYLIYTPKDKNDQNYRVIFETDGSKVTQLRAGLIPDVEAVEGCL